MKALTAEQREGLISIDVQIDSFMPVFPCDMIDVVKAVLPDVEVTSGYVVGIGGIDVVVKTRQGNEAEIARYLDRVIDEANHGKFD